MIIYFSGTGNTAMAALMLANELGDDCMMQMDSKMLLHPEYCALQGVRGRIIWAFPTYSWGIPPVVAKFMQEVSADESVENALHYMLTTCGDDIGYADRQWRSLMKKRGWNAVGAFAVQMPNTYVCMKGFDVDSPSLEKKKLSDAPYAVARIAESIINDGHDILIRKSFSWVKTYVIYPWFRKYAMSPKPFKFTESCISCGKCAASCPMSNIRMVNSHPSWSDRCAMCLRCYHICPAHAVDYDNQTASKGQYTTEMSHVCQPCRKKDL